MDKRHIRSKAAQEMIDVLRYIGGMRSYLNKGGYCFNFSNRAKEFKGKVKSRVESTYFTQERVMRFNKKVGDCGFTNVKFMKHERRLNSPSVKMANGKAIG